MKLEDFQDEICPECGKEFECLRLDQKYCSAACRERSNMRANNAARDERRRRERMGMTCWQCGGEFDGTTGFQRYCCVPCRVAAQIDVVRKKHGKGPLAEALAALRCIRCGSHIEGARKSCRKVCDPCHRQAHREKARMRYVPRERK